MPQVPIKRYRSRSMDKLTLPDPPPRKRFRNHSIEYILRRSTSPQIRAVSAQFGFGGRNEQRPLEYYVQQLEDNIEHNAKFHLTKTTSKFAIENIPADPESLLASIFHHCIERALANSRDRGCTPDRLGCVITSEMLENDIYIPIRAISDNTVNTILNRFLLVAQSKKQQELSLWGRPFGVSITCIDRKELPPKQIKGGSARHRKIAPLHHRIDKQCLIKVSQNCPSKT